MDTAQKLTHFIDVFHQSTEEKIQKMTEETEQQAVACVTEAEKRCAEQAEQEIRIAKSRIVAKYKKWMSQTGYRERTALLSRRQNMLISLFADLRERLIAFTESDEYRTWMLKLLKEHPVEENATILLREKDLPMQKALMEAAGVPCSVKTDPSIQLGGLSILSADGRRCENHTLDEAYSAQYRNFYRNHSFDGGNE